VLTVVERALDPVAVRLGDGLRQARTIAGCNQRQLARLLDVPPNYVSRWETGVRRLELETIERAEQVMQLQPGTVFRCAGYVEDNGLDMGSLDPAAQKAIKAILRAFGGDTSGEAVRRDGDDGP
jgi:transcriptional regulator with XRE-family HTH domain